MAPLDPIDREILRLLGLDGRASVAAIADLVRENLEVEISASAVRRRIARLQDEGFIVKYTVVVDHEKVGRSVEAYVELTLEGDADAQEILEEAVKMEAVREASTLAGDPDAIVRVRVDQPAQLRRLVTKLRNLPGVVDSKTLVSLGRLRHVAKPPGEEALRD